MKFTINIRHRPSMFETIEGRFQHFVGVLQSLPSPWGLRHGKSIVLPDVGTDLATDARLRGKLGTGLSGMVTFRYRVPTNLRDCASHDDSLVLDFEASDFAWADLVDVGFPGYLNAIGAYIGDVYRWDEAPDEWERLKAACDRSGKDLNGRDGFFRFGALSFMDRELCTRSCHGMRPEEIVEALRGAVPDVRFCNDGVMIVAASDFPSQDEINECDRTIRERLDLTVWADQTSAS